MSTYWAGEGKHQDLYNRLLPLLPAMGPCEGRANKALEALRKGGNAYYDIFNNGGGNRRQQIAKTFGLAMSNYRKGHYSYDWDRIHLVVEPVIDRLILAAAEEQFRN